MKANTPLKVHPAAEAYRLMNEDELASLAADIADNGLRDSIILGRIKGSVEPATIVDGRNRIKACEMAGVVPAFETRDFADEDAIRAFVKSRSERRDLTKSERAMGIALLFPEPRRGRGNIDPARKETESVSFTRIKEARQVLRRSPDDLAISVREGVTSLDEALAKIKADSDALQTKEAKTAKLRAEAPDLADLVVEGKMKLDEAAAAARERFDSVARQRKLVAQEIARAIDFFVQDNIDAATRAEQIAALFDLKTAPAMVQMTKTLELLVSRLEKGQADV